MEREKHTGECLLRFPMLDFFSDGDFPHPARNDQRVQPNNFPDDQTQPKGRICRILGRVLLPAGRYCFWWCCKTCDSVGVSIQAEVHLLYSLLFPSADTWWLQITMIDARTPSVYANQSILASAWNRRARWHGFFAETNYRALGPHETTSILTTAMTVSLILFLFPSDCLMIDLWCARRASMTGRMCFTASG